MKNTKTRLKLLLGAAGGFIALGASQAAADYVFCSTSSSSVDRELNAYYSAVFEADFSSDQASMRRAFFDYVEANYDAVLSDVYCFGYGSSRDAESERDRSVSASNSNSFENVMTGWSF